jgi:DME family drug/metabolite transporter
MTYIFGFGALTLLPFALFTGGAWTLSLPVLAAFAGFILFPTLGGFGLYTMGLQKLPASVAAIIATTEVPLAAIVAYLALGERLDGVQWAGMLLVMVGVALISMPRSWLGWLRSPQAAIRSTLH